jgi:hypothetical protein
MDTARRCTGLGQVVLGQEEGSGKGSGSGRKICEWVAVTCWRTILTLRLVTKKWAPFAEMQSRK